MLLIHVIVRRNRRNFFQPLSRGKAIFSRQTSESITNPSTPESIIDECLSLRASIQSLSDKFKGPLEKNAQKNTILPFVFLLGNHSSGKSSFINYVCQRKVQTAGVAPTDDGFTIIVPGPSDVDRDGPSFIGDPDMGFSGLRTFGPQLIHHTQLKVRSNIAFKNFMIIDSPGMIDSPVIRNAASNNSTASNILNSISGKFTATDRGYDFETVCKWYAQRADVILLFFDPDKPGTTGETLSILTNSLAGMDHKLMIILNKADQFTKMHDFARAYGTLGWNLSKVIQRKDLPPIYTMCLPKAYRSPTVEASFFFPYRIANHIQSILADEQGDSSSDDGSSLGRGLVDLEVTREEVVQEVLNAPKRRVDNEITRLTDSVNLLHMHLMIVDHLVKQLKQNQFTGRLAVAAGGLISAAAAVSSVALGLPLEVAAGSFSVSSLGTGAIYWYYSSRQADTAKALVNDTAMINAYKQLYARRIAEKDEFTASLWARVHEHLIMGFGVEEIKSMERIKSSELKELEKVLEIEIPNLRRKAAPAFNKKI